MRLRRLVRGRIDWPELETVVRTIAERYDRSELHVRFLEADNWLSTPMVVDEDLFVKIISKQNTMVHALFTTGRNIGAFSSGTEGFFESFQTPYEMARHELEATERMRELGVNAPEPIEAFEIGEYGIVVLEYLPDFRPLDELTTAETGVPKELFASLRTLHDAGLAHGDLRAENVLILDGELYFIDATNIRTEGQQSIQSYDVACGLAALEPLVGARMAVQAALDEYSVAELLDALDFLSFVRIRPDHEFDSASLTSEIEKRATNSRQS